MKNINNIKMAFFDVDNTLLCLKMYKDESGKNDKEYNGSVKSDTF